MDLQREANPVNYRKDLLHHHREQGQDVSAGLVFLLTAVMAAASGLGAVPFFFVGALSARWSALANAVACGVMLAASFDLVHEGEPYGAGLVILGVMLGASCMHPRAWLYALPTWRCEGLCNFGDSYLIMQVHCSSGPASSGWRSLRT